MGKAPRHAAAARLRAGARGQGAQRRAQVEVQLSGRHRSLEALEHARVIEEDPNKILLDGCALGASAIILSS
jgi:hypothetical protein